MRINTEGQKRKKALKIKAFKVAEGQGFEPWIGY